jgi:hypothetical protein
MKILELLSKIQLPITNEEAELLGEFHDKTHLYKSELDPRQQLLANQLVNKDVLYRIQENGRIIYRRKISGSGFNP